jgi:hypothetical protein
MLSTRRGSARLQPGEQDGFKTGLLAPVVGGEGALASERFSETSETLKL